MFLLNRVRSTTPAGVDTVESLAQSGRAYHKHYQESWFLVMALRFDLNSDHLIEYFIPIDDEEQDRLGMLLPTPSPENLIESLRSSTPFVLPHLRWTIESGTNRESTYGPGYWHRVGDLGDRVWYGFQTP